MSRKRALPTTYDDGEASRTTWVYFVSRDSVAGALSAKCTVWGQKPLRTKIGPRVTWVSERGHLGDFSPQEIIAWPAFRTYPETDMELIRIETRPTREELDRAKTEHGIK